jgi:hypothetical protein
MNMERKGDGERSPLGLANVGISVMIVMCVSCTLSTYAHAQCPALDTRELNPIVVNRIYVLLHVVLRRRSGVFVLLFCVDDAGCSCLFERWGAYSI